MFPKAFCCALIALFVLCSTSNAQVSMFYDTDGILTMGDDTVTVAPGDTVAVDVWTQGSSALRLNKISVHSCVSLPSVIDTTEPGSDILDWSFSTAMLMAGECGLFWAHNCLTFGISNFHVATIHVIVQGPGVLSAVLTNSFFGYNCGTGGLMEGANNIVFQVEPSGTSRSSWGHVKELFR